MGSIFDDAYKSDEIIEDFRKISFERAMIYLINTYRNIVIPHRIINNKRFFIQIIWNKEGKFVDSKGKVYGFKELKDLEFHEYVRMSC